MKTKTVDPYKEIVVLLQLNHIYPDYAMLVTKKGEEIIGLQVNCNPLTKDMRMDHINKVLEGKGFKTDYLPNHGYILITKLK